MSCCKKEEKAKAAEAACCETKPEEKATKTAEKSVRSGCGCGSSAESTAKKEEAKEASCC